MSTFETRINEITGWIKPRFRGLDPEARDEAVQNTLALAWKFWLRLVEQGKEQDEDIFRSMVSFAVRHTRMGRMPQGRGGVKPKDVLDYGRRRKGGVAIESVNLNHFVGRSADTVADIAAFRIDTQVFLGTLSAKHRRLALDLASGVTTTEAAKLHGVTPVQSPSSERSSSGGTRSSTPRSERSSRGGITPPRPLTKAETRSRRVSLP